MAFIRDEFKEDNYQMKIGQEKTTSSDQSIELAVVRLESVIELHCNMYFV